MLRCPHDPELRWARGLHRVHRSRYSADDMGYFPCRRGFSALRPFAVAVAISFPAGPPASADAERLDAALAPLSEGRIGETAERLAGDPALQGDAIALVVLGSLLEAEGRDEEAFEVYLDALRLHPEWVFRAREGGTTGMLGGATTVQEGIWARPPRSRREAVLLAQARLVLLGCRLGDAAWQRAGEVLPVARATEAAHWRETTAVASFPAKELGQNVWPRSVDIEIWLEAVKWLPSNEVLLNTVMARRPDIDWLDFQAWVLRQGSPLRPGAEARLRAFALQNSNASVTHWEALADWLEGLAEEQLGGFSADDLHALLTTLAFRRVGTENERTQERCREAQRRAFARLVETCGRDSWRAELLMASAVSALRHPSTLDQAVADANAAAALWAKLSPDDANGRGALPGRIAGSDLGLEIFSCGSPIYETLPSLARSFEVSSERNPLDPERVAALASPVLRVLALRNREARWPAVLDELADLGEEGDPRVRRDLRRLLWYLLPNEGDGRRIVQEDCEAAINDEEDPFFGFEAALHLSRQLGLDLARYPPRDHAFSSLPSGPARERLERFGAGLLEPGAATRPWAHILIARHGLWNHFDLALRLPQSHKFPVWDPEAWIARAEAGEETGLYALAARLRAADAAADAEEGLRLARLLRERYPGREEWAVELALRTPDPEETARLLDEAMADGEPGFRAALLATSPFRHREPEGLWDSERKEAAARRLADWERDRRPRGPRRWMREAIPMLAPFRPGDPAWDLLFDGAGSAEGAFELLSLSGEIEALPEEERLRLARRVLLSGACAREESPWIDRGRFFGQRELPRPYSLRRTARALPALLAAAERNGPEMTFPEGFVDSLEEVDPATARWLREILAGGEPAPLLDTEEAWFCTGQGPHRKALSKDTRPPEPDRSVLKFGVPWHERARHEALRRAPEGSETPGE